MPSAKSVAVARPISNFVIRKFLVVLPSPANAMSAKPDSDTRRTILVVDDFDDTRLLLRTWLEKKGFRVLVAEDGFEAVAQAESELPDLIIMDLQMPVMDGLAATRKIRKVTALDGVPIVAVSAYGAEQFRHQALAAGCDEYVSTPFDPDSLEGIIRSLVR